MYYWLCRLFVSFNKIRTQALVQLNLYPNSFIALDIGKWMTESYLLNHICYTSIELGGRAGAS